MSPVDQASTPPTDLNEYRQRTYLQEANRWVRVCGNVRQHNKWRIQQLAKRLNEPTTDIVGRLINHAFDLSNDDLIDLWDYARRCGRHDGEAVES